MVVHNNLTYFNKQNYFIIIFELQNSNDFDFVANSFIFTN